jgi:S-formylglutathione hydrolase FrmB
MAIVNLDLYSYELAMNTQVSLILPERRGVPHTPHDEPYPVLYLLHGHGQDHTSWLRLSRIEFYLQNSDVIVVMPNANRSSYVDGVNTHRYGSYLMDELPHTIKNWFNISTSREHTYIAGMSMGGYGSLHAALSRPEQYGAVCSMSAGIRMGTCDVKGKADKGLAIPAVPEIDRNFLNTFGPNDQYEGSDFDLKALAKKVNASNCPKPRILQLCGTEDPLYADNVEFAEFVKNECSNINHTWQDGPGIHDFNYWDQEAITMLKYFEFI